MPTIHEISDKYRISVRKLKLMQKEGLLNVDHGQRGEIEQMLYYLKKSRTMNVEQLLKIYRNPNLIDEFEGYDVAGRRQLRALGDVQKDALPAQVAASLIYGAYISDPASLDRLATWAQSVIPEKDCGYHYLAVRMLLNVAGTQFRESYAYVARAVVNLRKFPTMQPFIQKKGKGKAMAFQRPEQNFDL